MSNLIQEISEQHARLRKLEGDLEALRSQLRPAKKRIKVAREALDTMITELASGQSSLPLFRDQEPPAGNGQASPEPVPTTEADRQPVRTAPLEFASAKAKRRRQRMRPANRGTERTGVGRPPLYRTEDERIEPTGLLQEVLQSPQALAPGTTLGRTSRFLDGCSVASANRDRRERRAMGLFRDPPPPRGQARTGCQATAVPPPLCRRQARRAGTSPTLPSQRVGRPCDRCRRAPGDYRFTAASQCPEAMPELGLCSSCMQALRSCLRNTRTSSAEGRGPKEADLSIPAKDPGRAS